MKWEYCQVVRRNLLFTNALNKYGAKGWELVSVVVSDKVQYRETESGNVQEVVSQFIHLFKRAV